MANFAKWCRENKFSLQQVSIARGLLMSGPRSTPPRVNAIKKTMLRLRRGDNVGAKPGWRQAPAI